MEQLRRLQEALQSSWSLSEKERNELFKRVETYANTKDYTDFVREVREVFPLQENAGICELYLALGESEQSDRWSRFFMEEYRRGFELAKQHPEPTEVLDCLESIFFSEAHEQEYLDEVIDLLSAQLSAEQAEVRSYAIRMLGDWILPEDAGRYSHIMQKVRHRLQQDDHWRVRTEAADMLSEYQQLPADYRPRILDRIRRRLLA